VWLIEPDGNLGVQMVALVYGKLRRNHGGIGVHRREGLAQCSQLVETDWSREKNGSRVSKISQDLLELRRDRDQGRLYQPAIGGGPRSRSVAIPHPVQWGAHRK